MSDLREQLAQRLKFTADLAAKNQHPRQNARGAIWEHYWALADECIRQMEWAALKAHEQWEEDEGQEYPRLPLTAAPDDWTPNKEDGK